MAQHVRKGDLVQVIAGAAKGTQARVLRVIPKENRVVVEGVSVRTKHVKRSQQNPQGGTISRETAIHLSNVQPVIDGKPTRVRFESRPDGSKVRVAARGGAQIGEELRKARK